MHAPGAQKKTLLTATDAKGAKEEPFDTCTPSSVASFATFAVKRFLAVTNVLLSDFAPRAIIVSFVQEFWPAGFGGKLAGQANLTTGGP